MWRTMAQPVRIATTAAPQPVGHYSQARAVGSILAVAGQIGADPATGQLVGPDVATQTRQALSNLRAILAAAGLDFSHVIRLGVFLSDTSDFAAMNAVFAEEIPMPPPARTTVTVGLPAGARVEIDAIAAYGDPK